MNKRQYKKYCKKYKLKHYKMVEKRQQEILDMINNFKKDVYNRRSWWLRDIPQSSMFDILPKVGNRGDDISFHYFTIADLSSFSTLFKI